MLKKVPMVCDFKEEHIQAIDGLQRENESLKVEIERLRQVIGIERQSKLTRKPRELEMNEKKMGC